jgi:hypothetical protein
MTKGRLDRPVMDKSIPTDFVARRKEAELRGKYYFDEAKKPQGFTYNWKRHSCVGKEDAPYMTYLKSQYWSAVPGHRHPEAGGNGDSPIIIDGLMLMECPDHLVAYMNAEPAQKNAEAMNTQQQKIGASNNPDMPRVVQKFARTMDSGIPA